MPMLALGALLSGWALLVLLLTMRALAWDNPWMWGPPILFGIAGMLGGEIAISDEENRGAGVLFLLLGIGSAMVHIVIWFFAPWLV